MGLRFRRSVKICKGVRLNFGKTGTSLSFGVKGARYTIGKNGKRTATVGIPGTGIYYSATSNVKNSNHANSSSKTSNSKNKVVHLTDGTSIVYTPEHVKIYNEYIEKITQIHKSCHDLVDWEYIANLESPFVYGNMGPKEKEAKQQYDQIKPNLLEKFNKSAFEKRKENLFNNISVARELDKEAYNSWASNVSSANKVLNKDIEGYYDAINAADPFVELSELGNDIEFGTDDSKLIEVEFVSKIKDIVPADKLSLTGAGKVSQKMCTKTEIYSIAQDYVCSFSIRIARELFALLPIENVLVHATEILEDGRDTHSTILSVCFERSVFEKTDFAEYIDASDFVETCIHNMKFLKTQGFKQVERLSKDVIDLKINPSNSDINKVNSAKISKIKVELPFGWYSQNSLIIQPWENKLQNARNDYYSSKNVDDKIATLKNLISTFTQFKLDFESRGLYFAKYFDEMHMHNAGKKCDWVKEWKKTLIELEDSYLDSKEEEELFEKTLPTLKSEILNIIKNNQDILQKDLVKHFDSRLKQHVLNFLWELVSEGKVTKEKCGNSNVLKIK